MGKGKVKDKDLGYKKFVKKYESMEFSGFSLGVFESDPKEVMKAVVHEMGSPKTGVPARHWLTKFFDQHGKDVSRILSEGVGEFITEKGDGKAERDRVIGFRAQEIVELIHGFLIEGNLTPPLSPITLAQKNTDTMLFETGAMINAVALRYGDKGQEGSKAKEMARVGNNAGGGSRTGRPKSIKLLAYIKKLFLALKGPQLYEGYGQRKRAESKPGTSTTVRWPSGYKRMPVRSGNGRYPSNSRPK